MGNPLKAEDPDRTYLLTSRTIASRLWFVNNPQLHSKVLAFLARYQELYGVILYAFVIMGNHYHLIARFPRCNKADFMRDFNSIFARLVASEVPSYPGGKLWARRYSEQVLPNDFDITHWFLYVVLNPVTTGICTSIGHYSGYSSWQDCISLRLRRFKVFEQWKYNEARRYCDAIDPREFESMHTLRFSKLPEYADLADQEYREKVRSRIQAHEQSLQSSSPQLNKRVTHAPRKLRVKVGSMPLKTKVGTRSFGRPLVLTLCSRSREEYLSLYFQLRDWYRLASKAFREGARDTIFPPGTYRPITRAT